MTRMNEDHLCHFSFQRLMEAGMRSKFCFLGNGIARPHRHFTTMCSSTKPILVLFIGFVLTLTNILYSLYAVYSSQQSSQHQRFHQTLPQSDGSAKVVAFAPSRDHVTKTTAIPAVVPSTPDVHVHAPDFPTTIFTPHVQEVISVIQRVTLNATTTNKWRYDPHMYCPQSYRVYVNKPYSAPTAIECRPANSWCAFLQQVFESNRTLPFNVSIGESQADRIKLDSMAYGNCLGSSSPKGVFSMNNFQNVKDIITVSLEAESAPSPPPWGQRHSLPLFRGHARPISTRRMRCEGRHVKDGGFGPRPQAVWLAIHQFPHLMDASLTGGTDSHPCQALNATNGMDTVFGYGNQTADVAKKIPSSEYYSMYQTVVVLGGIGAAFRLTDHLKVGQAIVLQDFAYEEWFVPFMQPHVHYIPLQEDLSDLQTVLEYVRDNPNKVKEVARKGQQFYAEYLSPTNTMRHWHELLWRLSMVQQEDKNRWYNASHRTAWPQPFVPKRFVRTTNGQWTEEARNTTRQPYLEVDVGFTEA